MTTTPPHAVDAIVTRAEQAAPAWGAVPPVERARALRQVADAIDTRAGDLVALAEVETHLAEPRLRGELRRTTFQLRLFADVVTEGGHLDARIDHADPDWPMGAPRPDLRRMLVPVGPVLVFAAGNFPFAFSVAGGDVASALAAGCPVVVKVHPGHPRLSAATASAVGDALAAGDTPDGVFAVISGVEAGVRALEHAALRAAAFTGSTAAGRTLFDIAQARPQPIPFHGELGSVNPVFVTRAAVAERLTAIRDGLVASFTASAGQLCTKPGIVVLPAGSGLTEALRTARLGVGSRLLSERNHDGYVSRLRSLKALESVELLSGAAGAFDPRPDPVLLRTTVSAALGDAADVMSECFGPTTILVEYDDDRELLSVARSLEGQLTATVHATDADADDMTDLLAVLADRAGRVVWNEWPTGVSVTHAQQHGGPYPAATSPTTSVGSAAIDRFLRPVAYQNFPDRLLSPVLREANPWGVPRLVNGVRQLRPTTATG